MKESAHIRHVTPDQLIAVINEVIIPLKYTFYEIIMHDIRNARNEPVL
jgi:hypothetical protein